MITIILHSPFATSHICYSEVNWNLADLRLSNAQNGTLNYWELRWFGFQYKVQTKTAIPLPLKAFLSFFFFFFFFWLTGQTSPDEAHHQVISDFTCIWNVYFKTLLKVIQ